MYPKTAAEKMMLHNTSKKTKLKPPRKINTSQYPLEIIEDNGSGQHHFAYAKTIQTAQKNACSAIFDDVKKGLKPSIFKIIRTDGSTFENGKRELYIWVSDANNQ